MQLVKFSVSPHRDKKALICAVLSLLVALAVYNLLAFPLQENEGVNL